MSRKSNRLKQRLRIAQQQVTKQLRDNKIARMLQAQERAKLTEFLNNAMEVSLSRSLQEPHNYVVQCTFNTHELLYTPIDQLGYLVADHLTRGIIDAYKRQRRGGTL